MKDRLSASAESSNVRGPKALPASAERSPASQGILTVLRWPFSTITNSRKTSFWLLLTLR
jgi:hypothetical protein